MRNRTEKRDIDAAAAALGTNINKRARVDRKSEGLPNPAYPETMSSFVAGIGSDLFELYDSGAKVFQKSFEFLKPAHKDTNTTDNNIDNIVVPPKSLRDITEDIKQKDNQVKTAIRMRCSSTWNEKDAQPATKSKVARSKSKGSMSSNRAKEGEKVQLDKLKFNNNLQVFQYYYEVAS